MSFLERITPVVLSLDEEPNIGRCLERLNWARDIVVVDSFSQDRTVEICRALPRVRVCQRTFDSFANQWRHAIRETEIDTDWVLALDSDYLLTDAVTAELAGLDPSEDIHGYLCPIRYVSLGREIRSGIYPPVMALYRREGAELADDGHTFRVLCGGRPGSLRNSILHDDRKNLDRWVRSQVNYAKREAGKIRASGTKGWLRSRTPLAPFAVGFHCLFVRGGIFEGPPGWFYALQRMAAEALIAAFRFDLAWRTENPEARRSA